MEVNRREREFLYLQPLVCRIFASSREKVSGLPETHFRFTAMYR